MGEYRMMVGGHARPVRVQIGPQLFVGMPPPDRIGLLSIVIRNHIFPTCNRCGEAGGAMGWIYPTGWECIQFAPEPEDVIERWERPDERGE